MDALFTRYLVVAFYFVCAGGLLSACSPSEENEADYAEEQWEDEDLAEGEISRTRVGATAPCELNSSCK